ncbi:MAG: P27 family phage terminase small subunit [Eubacterium sp.]
MENNLDFYNPNNKTESFFENMKQAVIEDLKSTGVYRPEFNRVISVYTEILVEYCIIQDQWRRSGCVVQEQYVNKNGAKNMRKTALYQSLEQLRKDMQYYETALGLTPAGLKKIDIEVNKTKNVSPLERFVDQLEKQN